MTFDDTCARWRAPPRSGPRASDCRWPPAWPRRMRGSSPRRARRRRCAGAASRDRQVALHSGRCPPRAAGRPLACASSRHTAAAGRAPAAHTGRL
eukprot:scaffold71934_cov77-Phaeocystis_antarctica.AAC.2